MTQDLEIEQPRLKKLYRKLVWDEAGNPEYPIVRRMLKPVNSELFGKMEKTSLKTRSEQGFP